ncbi:MAG: HD-GYP domain-containing protein [Spirochaetaceae bacterium]|nr:MAG: HD-GYP domain-containing protein [Spirochaetaceae bacterium]
MIVLASGDAPIYTVFARRLSGSVQPGPPKSDFRSASDTRGGQATKGSKIPKLKRIPLFAEMSEYDLHQIDQITVERRYDKGEVIIEENTAAERFFIIFRGKIEITKRFEDGEQFVLGVHSDGECFGEMAILDEGPRSATARALESTTVMEISRTDFEALLYTAPVLAFTIMKALSSRLRETGALLISYLQRKNRQLARAYLDTVNTVVHAIEERDSYAKGHTDRVAEVSKLIGAKMALGEEEMFNLEIGALLHDIGKIGIPETILLKPEPLKPEERKRVQQHPLEGKRMIQDISFLKAAIPHVLYHHERYDGSGYPEHLAGADIPVPSRIIAVADVFDAVTNDRPQRKRMSFDEAVKLIKKGSGTQFDPKVVKAFLKLVESGELKE